MVGTMKPGETRYIGMRLLCAGLFVFIGAHAEVGNALGGQWIVEAKQIAEALKRGECDDANKIARIVASKDNAAPPLPEWHYQIMLCRKAGRQDFSPNEVAIEEYFQRRFDNFLEKKGCAEAERYLASIDKKYYSHRPYNYAKWQFTVARCYEAIDWNKALVMYKELVAKYPGMVEAKFRINFLTGDRSWIFPRPAPVINGVRQAFKDKDVRALERLASKSFFLYGFEERLHPAFFDESMQRFFEKKFKGQDVLVGEVEARSRDLFMLQVVFTDEEYPFWYFMLERQDGGWQWTGIMISNVSRDEPVLTPRIKKSP